jgi:predicted phosphate transport protein (TIGR00153 family)
MEGSHPSRIGRLRKALGGQTTLEGALESMGREREEQVLRQVSEFTDQVVNIVEQLAGVVQVFATGDQGGLSEAVAELDRLESEADDSKQHIADALAAGGVFLMARADLMRLVGSMDGIANYAVGAADRIAMRPLTLTSEMRDLMLRMVELDVEAVRRLRDAVDAVQRDFREAISIAAEVDKIESRADDVFAAMYKLMFDLDMDYKTFHQLKAIIERLESIADKSAQNAELIRHMALEYLEA